MTEPAAEPQQDDQTSGRGLVASLSVNTPPGNTPPDDDTPVKPLGEAGEKALSVERQARKDADKKARELERELTRLRQAQMSESERAVAEAREQAAKEARTSMAERLARAEFRAAAAGVKIDTTSQDFQAMLDDIDVRKFVTDDGEPDDDRIKASVARFAALNPAPRPPSFDGGVRTSAPAAANMNEFIRNQAGIRPT